MASISGMTLSVGLAGIAKTQSNFEVAADKNVRIVMPEGCSHEHILLATKDTEILTKILKEHPEEIVSIMEDITSGKLSDAKKAAAEIGISEENFINQGGGMWAVIAIAIGCALLLSHD
jgi:hypothetical protein